MPRLFKGKEEGKNNKKSAADSSHRDETLTDSVRTKHSVSLAVRAHVRTYVPTLPPSPIGTYEPSSQAANYGLEIAHLLLFEEWCYNYVPACLPACACYFLETKKLHFSPLSFRSFEFNDV